MWITQELMKFRIIYSKNDTKIHICVRKLTNRKNIVWNVKVM